MSQFWHEAESKLRAMELDEKHDLFAVGYLIPQVALAEGEWQAPEEPFTVLTQFVERSIQQDELTEQDAQLVDVVLQLLK